MNGPFNNGAQKLDKKNSFLRLLSLKSSSGYGLVNRITVMSSFESDSNIFRILCTDLILLLISKDKKLYII